MWRFCYLAVSDSGIASPLQEPERSSGSQEKLLRKEGSGLGKWGSMSTNQKFDVRDLMAEVIENSEEVSRFCSTLSLGRWIPIPCRAGSLSSISCSAFPSWAECANHLFGQSDHQALKVSFKVIE